MRVIEEAPYSGFLVGLLCLRRMERLRGLDDVVTKTTTPAR
jgi:hypothetical protein